VADLGIRYATALFQISEEGGLLNEYLEQAKLICSALDQEDAIRLLTHPRITGEEKFTFLNKAFGELIHQDLLGFIRLVIDKNREEFLVPALYKLIDLIDQRQNRTTAKVVSAVPLTDAQAAQISSILSKKLNKEVDLTVLVDTSQIAGLSILVDGYYVDRTVKSMLKDMKETIKRGANE